MISHKPFKQFFYFSIPSFLFEYSYIAFVFFFSLLFLNTIVLFFFLSRDRDERSKILTSRSSSRTISTLTSDIFLTLKLSPVLLATVLGSRSVSDINAIVIFFPILLTKKHNYKTIFGRYLLSLATRIRTGPIYSFRVLI